MVEHFRGLKLLKDFSGVVFDLPVKQMQIFEGESDEIKKDGYEITTPAELPEVEHKPKDKYGREMMTYDRNGGRGGNNF